MICASLRLWSCHFVCVLVNYVLFAISRQEGGRVKAQTHCCSYYHMVCGQFMIQRNKERKRVRFQSLLAQIKKYCFYVIIKKTSQH